MNKLELIYQHIAGHQDAAYGPAQRLLKLAEEVGEVSEAYIGYTGANKRKGHTHSREDILNELCDVIITAFVAMHDWTLGEISEDYFQDRLNIVYERVLREGS
jgi:NTP pyrophosphatase (non-canonical NTP hydrolase)